MIFYCYFLSYITILFKIIKYCTLREGLLMLRNAKLFLQWTMEVLM